MTHPTDHDALLAQLVESDLDSTTLSPEEALRKQWELLATGLHCESEAHRHSFNRLVASLNSFPLFRSFQLWDALSTCNAFLAGLSYQLPEPVVGPSGAAPLDRSRHWKWAESPLQPYHAELGLAWAILGKISGRADYIQAALKVAEWQLQLLDSNGKRAPGLLTAEADGNSKENDALLFLFVGTLAQESALAGLGQALLTPELEADPLVRWLHRHYPPRALPTPQLTSTLCDPNTSLVGFRQPEASGWATLCGGASGLGSYRYRDVEVLAYGPQHLPVADFTGFGIESFTGEATTLHAEATHYRLHGRTRMTPKPLHREEHALFRSSPPSPIWLDCAQEGSPAGLGVDVRFRSLHCLDSLAFTFAVKCERCQLEDQTVIPARSLDRYEGACQGVILSGESGKLHFSSLPGRGLLQVIPLAGDESFWGATFLITLGLESSCKEYRWRLVPTR